MPESRSTIPQPTPIEDLPSPEMPASLQTLPPRLLRVTQLVATGTLELAIVYKRTYKFGSAGSCQVADEQRPLAEEAKQHTPLTPEVEPSFSVLTEVVGYKNGTDVVVQASARSPRPVETMSVGVQIGKHQHVARITGRRFCDFVDGKLVFTPPELFQEIPLRYENAYGGRDKAFEDRWLSEIDQTVPVENLRKTKGVFSALLSANHPLMYPRNRFGKGYILDDRRESTQGRELPNLERPDDLLTPEKAIIGNPMHWSHQPIPVGFDYLDPLSFPRSAMLGIPPASFDKWESVAEVARGLIPDNFCRGNVFSTKPDQFVHVLHPSASRCASLGLWLPFLNGDEEVVLSGMDESLPQLRTHLPKERPDFTLPGSARSAPSMKLELHLVALNVPKRLLEMIWVGRIAQAQPLAPEQERELETAIQVRIKKF